MIATSILNPCLQAHRRQCNLVTLRGRKTQVPAHMYFWTHYFKRYMVRGKSWGGCRSPISISWCSVYSVTPKQGEAAKCPPPITTVQTSSPAGPALWLGAHHTCDWHQNILCMKQHLLKSLECQVLFLSFSLQPWFLNLLPSSCFVLSAVTTRTRLACPWHSTEGLPTHRATSS